MRLLASYCSLINSLLPLINRLKSNNLLIGEDPARRIESSLVSPKRVVGCKGGSRYVEGCWGFPYSEMKSMASTFQSFKASKIQKIRVSKFQRFKVPNFQSFKTPKLLNVKLRNSQTCGTHISIFSKNTYRNSQSYIVFKKDFGCSWIIWSVPVSPKIKNKWFRGSWTRPKVPLS